MTIINCSKCGTKNRIDPVRADHGTAKCGKCGAALRAADTTPMAISDGNFSRDVLGAGVTPVLVDCWAVWCPPCRAIAPIIDELAAESAGRWKIGKLNIDENPRAATDYKIDSIPTLLIFKEGKLVDRIVGLNPKGVIAAKLAKWA